MRYDVSVKMTLTHVMAIEATSLFEAQGKALTEIVERDPDRAETLIEIEVGNG